MMTMTQDEYRAQNVLRQALSTPEGRMRIGEDLLSKSVAASDYNGLARKVLRVRELHQGELQRLWKDVDATAYFLSSAYDVEAQRLGRFVCPYEPCTQYSVMIPDAATATMAIMAELQRNQEVKLIASEDEPFVRLLDVASKSSNDVIATMEWCPKALDELITQIERCRLVVDKLLISIDDATQFRESMRYGLKEDPIDGKGVPEYGYHGMYRGIKIMSEAKDRPKVLPRNTLYAVAPPEYIGEFGVRANYQVHEKFELEMDPYWRCSGIWSQAIVNTRGIAKLIRV